MESRLPKKSTCAGEIVPDHDPRPPKSEWVISIEKKLTQGHQDNVPDSWTNLSIYRIPRYLKHGEDKAWVPQIVSLGPYHHGKEHLRDMERHKWRCLHRILERTGRGIGHYLESVMKVEQRAHACYEGRISMSCDEFVEMMVLDGCFVIEMFQGFAKGFEKLGYPLNDPVFSRRGLLRQIRQDMIMLENQIPLFILDQLLGLQLGDPNQEESVAKLVLQFFGHPDRVRLLEKLPSGDVMEQFRFLPLDDSRFKFDPSYDHVHCLEVVWRSLLHVGEKRQTELWLSGQDQLTFCLSELREAGIQIRQVSGRSWGDIKFKNGILEFQTIEIHEGTRPLFLNLIAFEQSHFNCNNYVTSYVIFMHNLINSPEDVRYLRDCKIIEHCLGSDTEVADLFHQLCQEVPFNRGSSHLLSTYRNLRMYYFGELHGRGPSKVCLAFGLVLTLACNFRAFLTRKWNAWIAILKNKYFDNPWSIISLIAAFVLLVLTFIQTFFAVYAYYKPQS